MSKSVEQMTQLLRANHIYELGSYGWIDSEAYDPELVGHAMWQTHPPWWTFLEVQRLGLSPPHPSRWQKCLAIAGGDFEGLMEASRLSVGLMLLAEESHSADSFFSVHLMGAMILLGAASDRLRDLFVATVFHKSTDEYYRGRKHRLYTAPFEHAIESLEGYPEQVTASVATLSPLAKQLQEFRRVRNNIVHDVATELGRQQQRLVNDPPVGDELDWELTDKMVHELSEQNEACHKKRLSQPICWYKLLINASNHVFIVENKLRV